MSGSQEPGINLELVHRDVRVTAPGVRVALACERYDTVGQFAQAIVQRFMVWQLRWPHLGLVFGQPWPAISEGPVHHHTQVHLAHHLRLTVRSLQQPFAPPPAGQHVERRPEGLQVRHRLVATPVEAFVYRFTHRGERVEAVAAPGPRLQRTGLDASVQGGMEGPGISAARPVSRVVRRQPATMAADGQTPMPATTEAGSSPRLVAATKRGSAETVPIDLDRLTDQVVQTIDRRIIARRERMGRI